MRRVGVAAPGLAVALAASLLAWSPAADAGFPGRDGRLMWVESTFARGLGTFDFPSGRQFFVFQSRLPGEDFEDVGGLVCDNRYADEPCPYRDPSFSPDGESVLFETNPARDPDGPRVPESLPARGPPVLALVGADERSGGSRLEPLPALTEADRDPAWSPDGGRIVFSGEVEGNRDLYVVDRDGSGLRRLTSHPKVEREPAWSARGEIAFVRGRVLYRIRPDGTGLERLNRRGRVPDWSPNGRRLVYTHKRRVFTLRRDGRVRRRLTRRGGLYPAWSPSGRRIAFRRNYDIYTVGVDNRGLRRAYDWPSHAGYGSPSQYAPHDIDWGPRQR